MASGATFHAKITADAREFIQQVEDASAALQGLVGAYKETGKASGATTGNKKGKKQAEQDIKSLQQEAMKAGSDAHKKALGEIKKETEERTKGAREVARAQKEQFGPVGRRTRMEGPVRAPGQGEMADLTKLQIAYEQLNRSAEKFVRTVNYERRERAEGPSRGFADETKLLQAAQNVNRQRQMEKEQVSAILEDRRRHEAAERNISRENRQQMDAMVTGRYALYDMASTYQQIMQTTAQIAKNMVSVVAVTAQFETAFTAVERATQLRQGTAAFEDMRKILVDLSTQIPIAFEGITEIATLGAQMGIATKDLEGFTRTVASFGAITGATAEDVATKFGRIAALADVPSEDFDKLASSVLFAGFNAVATEAEILSMVQSIAAAARNAGYAADQTIGLATAIASLGIAPEQARGVILRVFDNITRAVEGGSDKLGEFAKVAGMSAENAQYLWKESPEQFFTAMLTGLGSVESFTAAMDAMGLTNTRERNVLQRLSQNMDVYSQSLQEASQSYAEGTFLQEAYSATADDLEAKMTRLVNAFQEFQAAAGGSLSEILKPTVEILINLSKAAADFVKTDIGKFLIPISTALVTAVAAFAAFNFAINIAKAQTLAMRTAFLKMQESTHVGSVGIRSFVQALTGNVFVTKNAAEVTEFLTKAQIQARVATGQLTAAQAQNILTTGQASVRVRLLTASLRALTLVGSAVALGSVIGIMLQMRDAANEVGQSVGGVRALAEAIGQDTEAYTETGEAIALHTFKVRENDEAMSKNASDSRLVIDAQGRIAQEFEDTTTAITTQTAAIGENFKALLLQDISQSQDFSNLFSGLEDAGTGVNELFDAMGIKVADLVDAAAADPEFGAINLLRDGLATAQANAEKFSPELQKVVRELIRVENGVAGANFEINDLEAFFMGAGGAATDLGRILTLVDKENVGVSNSTVYLAQDLGKLVGAIQRATKGALSQFEILQALGGAFGGVAEAAGDASDETDGLDDSMSGLSKTLRTVLDFASDIAGVFSRVIELDFGKQIAFDAITTGWRDISESADKAREAIEDANNEIKDLTADRTILEYQLTVAERYGDEARAAKIRAELAKLNEKIVDTEEKKSQAEQESSKSLSGNTEAAIENRASILGLVSDYQDYIETLAKLGRTPGQLAGDIQVLKRQFREQAIAAGFAAGEIDEYLALFDQFGAVATGVPRDVDIEVALGLTAAEQAIQEFLAKNREMGVDVKLETEKAKENTEDLRKRLASLGISIDPTPAEKEIRKLVGSSGLLADRLRSLGVFIDAEPAKKTMSDFTKIEYRPNIVADRIATASAGSYLRNWADAASKSLKITPEVNPKISKQWVLDYARQQLAIGNTEDYRTIINAYNRMATGGLVESYQTGGFVRGPGTGTSDSIPTMLSNGEFVIQAKAVSSYGVDFMNALNQQRVGVGAPAMASAASMSSGSTVAYLSPEDRSLLRAVINRPVALYADSIKIAQSANAGNVILGQRGIK